MIWLTRKGKKSKLAGKGRKRAPKVDKLDVYVKNILKTGPIKLYKEEELLGNVRVHDTEANTLVIDYLTQSRALKKEDVLTLRYKSNNRDVELTGRFQRRDHFRLDKKMSIPVMHIEADEFKGIFRRNLLRIDFDGVPDLSLHARVSLMNGEVFSKGSKILKFQEITEDGWRQCRIKDLSGAGTRIVGNELYESIGHTPDLREKILHDVLDEINSKGGLLVNLNPNGSDKLHFRYDMPDSIKFVGKVVGYTVDPEKEMVYYSIAFTHRVITSEDASYSFCELKDVSHELGDPKIVQFISAVDYYMARAGVAR